jgi:hypothetical protein
MKSDNQTRSMGNLTTTTTASSTSEYLMPDLNMKSPKSNHKLLTPSSSSKNNQNANNKANNNNNNNNNVSIKKQFQIEGSNMSVVGDAISGSDGKKIRDLRNQSARMRQSLNIDNTEDDVNNNSNNKKYYSAFGSLPDMNRRERDRSPIRFQSEVGMNSNNTNNNSTAAVASSSSMGPLDNLDSSSISKNDTIEEPWLLSPEDNNVSELSGHLSVVTKLFFPKKTNLLFRYILNNFTIFDFLFRYIYTFSLLLVLRWMDR